MIVQASRPVFTTMIHHRRAFALFKLASLEDALSDVNLAIRATARIKAPDMHYLKTDIQLGMGDYAGAMKAYQEGLAVVVKGRTANKRRMTKCEEEMVERLTVLVPKRLVGQGTLIDPIVLPMDVVELIMQHGITNDEYFALKASWVSQTWRTAIHDMPSLWRTYTYNPAAKQTSADKRKAWAAHAGNRFHEVRLVDVDSVTAMKKVNASWKPVLKDLQTLTLRGTTTRKEEVVEQLGKAHKGTYMLKRLNVEPFLQSSVTCNELDLGLLSDDNRAVVDAISIQGISFQDGGAEETAKGDMVEAEYAALRELHITKCYFNQVHEGNWAPTPVGQPQTDPLHQVLRTALNLEVLQFSSSYLLFGRFTTYDRPLTDLEHLHTLRIPPPSLWTIDIKTPQVRHLAFDLMQSVDRSRHVVADQAATTNRGLIPELGSFAATGIDVSRLVTVELVINGSDTKERIHAWLGRMENVEKLVIRSPKLSGGTMSQLSPYYSPTESRLEEVSVGSDQVTTANRSFVTLLQEDTRLCPKLKELHLTNIYSPEAPLLKWIQDRKRYEDVADIQTLSLVHCTFITSIANRQLHQEIPQYSNVEYAGISRLGWKELCENWDEDVKSYIKVDLAKGYDAVVPLDHADVKFKKEE
jgi:hypothetical protein